MVDKYQVESKHKEVYKNIKKSVDLDYLVKRSNQHTKGLRKALEVIEDVESLSHPEELAEALTDAVIEYKKSAGIPVSTKAKDRHNEFNKIYSLLNSEDFKDKFLKGRSAVSLAKHGKISDVLSGILEMEREGDIEGNITYNVRKNLPSEFKQKDYHGIAKEYANNHPDIEFTDGELLDMGNRENILGKFVELYQIQLENVLKKVPHKKYKPKANVHELHPAKPVNEYRQTG